jgi:hypothetical protein
MTSKTWIPKTDAEIEAEIDKIKVNNKEPRPLSLVRFTDDSMFRQYVRDDPEEDMSDYRSLLFLGPIPNQSGHGAYINIKFNTTHVIDIEELVELTEDEL